jgi:F-type H+-transporting ATPase subunit b
MLKIPPDFTILFLQIAIFVVLWVVLTRLWFKPALRILHERAARSEGAVREARAIQAEAERLRAEHAAALDQVRGEAQREMQEIVRGAETEQKRMIAEAREEAQRTLTEVRGRVAEEVANARRGLREQAEQIAREVVEKVLGRPA